MKKLQISLAAILLYGVVHAQIPTASLVGYWHFNNGDANDYSGNTNNGTVSGATLTTDRFGNSGMAYSFDGVNDIITVNTSTSIDMPNGADFSVAFWIKTYTGPTTNGIPLSKNVYGQTSSYQFFTNNTDPGYCTSTGQLSFYTSSGASQDACADNAICTGTNLNTWFFITGIYDGALSTSSLYVNGVLQSDIGASSGSMNSAANLTFGGHPNNVLFFKGALDDIRIYKTKLNQTEILALYNECDPVPPAAPVNVTPPANQSICANNNATLSASTPTGSVNWYATLTGTAVLGTGNVFVTQTLTPGTYTFYAEASTCTVSANRTAITVTVDICTGLNTNHYYHSSTKLFPNPTEGTFSIESAGKLFVTVTNLFGAVIMKEEFSAGTNSINIGLYPNGVYFVRTENESGVKTFKLVKE